MKDLVPNAVAGELVNFLISQIERQPALKDELKWFYQDHELLQFFDALRVIGESEGGVDSVYKLGRLAAKSMIPEAPQRPDLAIELGARKIASLVSGFKASIKKIGRRKAEIITGFDREGFFGGWAFCNFVEGWFVGALEQSRVERVSSAKTSCIFSRGKFLFNDGELRAGLEKEVIFYPKTGGSPRIVDKRTSAGGFRFGRMRFGERFCTYNLYWKPQRSKLSAIFGAKKSLAREREAFYVLIDKVEKEVELYLRDVEHVREFREKFTEFLRASGTITSTNELWDAVSRCAHAGINFDRMVVFEVKQEGLVQVYHWDVDKCLLDAPPVLRIDPRSPEAFALKEGRDVVVNTLARTIGVLPIFSQKWFSPGYIVVPMGEPPGYDYLVWADMYKSKRPPKMLEATEMNILVSAASLALAKLGSVEELEERIEERTRTLRELTARLNKLYQEVKESEIIKSQILSMVGHELRTPLNSILGIAQLLLKGMDGPITGEQKEDLDAILKSGEHLLGLIDDLLDLSKLEAKRLEIEPRLVDIAEELKEVVRFVGPQAEEKGLTFITSMPEHLEAEVDPKRIVQIVTNLCTNAVKYTDEGGVRLELRESDGELVITVDDTGTGIPKKYRERIFEPFFRVVDRKGSGLGLGLAISRHLVGLHNGRIEVGDSEMGGAKFTVKIPMVRYERG